MVTRKQFLGKTSLEMNMGQEVVIMCDSGEFLGIVNSSSYEQGEVYLLPHIQWSPDKKKAAIEREMPLTISLAHFMGDRKYVIIPKPTGYMQSVIDMTNSRNYIGFGQEEAEKPDEKKTR
jgi:hypothetical protein